ncbi:14576_t:CDS:2 [Entrophospora sp. SA101]|nr:14576_t:CDS:2 [Entrophospora sp. SA101]
MVVILTSSLNYLNPFTKISNTDLVANLFSECSDKKDSLVALISKFLTCIITFGIRTPAGIFIPALLIGACFGRMLGLYPDSPVFEQCDPRAPNDCVIPGVYAMVGAAAALAGVTRMTVSLTVIMFELTGALTYVLPIMTSIMISKWVADGFVHHGIYNLLIDLNEHPFLDANAEYIQATNTFDLTQKDLEVIDVNDLNTVAISGYSDTGFPIIDNNMLVGYIASTELEHALNDLPPKYDATTRCYFKEPEFSVIQNPDKSVDFTVYMDQAPLTVSKNSSLEVILELFKKLGLRYVCVTENGQYVGVIHKKWLLRYLKEMEGKKED